MGDGFRVEALPLRHTKPCLAILTGRQTSGQFHPEQAAKESSKRSVRQYFKTEEVTNTDGTVVHRAGVGTSN